MPAATAKRASGTTWSWLKPRIITALSFTPGKPAARAASTPCSTAANSPVRVRALNFSASRVSSEMLTRRTPAARSGLARRGSCEPLVVIATSRTPGRAAKFSHSRTTPFRTSGSPPLTRILSTPRRTKARATSSNSSSDRTSLLGRNFIFIGMQ